MDMDISMDIHVKYVDMEMEWMRDFIPSASLQITHTHTCVCTVKHGQTSMTDTPAPVIGNPTGLDTPPKLPWLICRLPPLPFRVRVR